MTGALASLSELRGGFESQKSSSEWKINRIKASKIRHCRTVMTFSHFRRWEGEGNLLHFVGLF